MKMVRAVINKIQPTVKVIETTRCDVPVEEIIGTDRFDFETVYASAGWVKALEEHDAEANDDDDDHDEHEHHHDHDHEHEHHHHHHDHDHHGHHHADEIFSEMGVNTAHKYTKEQIEEALKGLDNFAECGQVLRSKGIVEGVDGTWIHFDYVPGEPEVREGTPEATGMICVIGVDLEEDRIRELFLLD
jgi:G3E family GTPase